MNWTDEQAMRIGYLIIRKSPESAESLWEEAEEEKSKVMEHNNNNKYKWDDTTSNYQSSCVVNHRTICKKMTTDTRGWLRRVVERWV